jgi:serine/threonine-protein kinase
MATVHLARQLGAAGFSRFVAIKRAHERYSRDAEFVAMFLDEARIVARIRHPNVVQTIDVVAEDGELFLVMEYIHGESLLHFTRAAARAKTTLPIPVVTAVMAGVLHGLHAAHEARGETGELLEIVHRDISPHNILVGVDGMARVLDFGVAKAAQRIQTTEGAQVKGKLSYMAPEQMTNGVLDRRVDIYASGVVLWEALAGTKLFGGENEGATVEKILRGTLQAPSSVNPAVTQAVDDIVMRALARDPQRRFATAREMALALEHALPLASPAEIGELVSGSCSRSISPRRELMAAIESQSSASMMREAVDSLRLLHQPRSKPGDTSEARVPAPATPPPPPGAAVHESQPPRAASIPGPVTTMVGMAIPEPQVLGGSGTSRRAVVALLVSSLLSMTALGAGGYLLSTRMKAKLATAGAAENTAAPRLPSVATAGASSASAPPATEMPPACPTGMARVQGGRFFMGSDDDLPAERPAHKVTLRTYCMDMQEVTTDAYRRCSDRGDCKRAGVTNKWSGITPDDSRAYDPLCNAGGEHSDRGDHPINCVDWKMADRYCKAEGKRLPTEAEWEFAARGSDGRKYPWGDDAPSVTRLNACGAECTAWGNAHGTVLSALFGESDPWPTTSPVGSFPLGASASGIVDLVGNVWEWISDYYAPYTDADREDPSGPPTGVTHVMRGGAWNGAQASWVRPSFRFHGAEGLRSHGIGFRCARTL